MFVDLGCVVRIVLPDNQDVAIGIGHHGLHRDRTHHALEAPDAFCAHDDQPGLDFLRDFGDYRARVTFTQINMVLADAVSLRQLHYMLRVPLDDPGPRLLLCLRGLHRHYRSADIGGEVGNFRQLVGIDGRYARVAGIPDVDRGRE